MNQEGLFLEVINEGAAADVTARIELVSGRDKAYFLKGAAPKFEGYPAVWQSTGRPATRLVAGGTDRIFLGRIETNAPAVPLESIFKLAYYDAAAGGVEEYATTGWLEGVAVISPPHLELRVTVSAAKRSCVTTFTLDPDDPKVLRDETPFSRGLAGIRVDHF